MTDWLLLSHKSLAICGINHTKNFEKLQRTLVYVQSILEDAEEKQVNDRDVRTWFSQPKLAVYIAEDSLYEIYFYNTAQHGSGMKLNFIGSEYADNVKEMLFKLEAIRDEGSKFNLRECRMETSSFVFESEVYGRERKI